MKIEAVVSAVINAQHGWAVAEQFESTFRGESFEERNSNALNYILRSVNVLIGSDLLSEDAQDELQSYADELGIYLAKN